MEENARELTEIATVVTVALGCGLILGRLRQPAIVGYILLQTAGRDRPNNDPGRVLHYHDHATQILVGNVVVSVAALLMGYALLYLYKATKGRRPATS